MLKTKKKGFLKTLLVGAIAVLLCAMSFLSVGNQSKRVSARATDDDESYTIVGTLNDGTDENINSSVLLALFKALTGDGTLADVSAGYQAVATSAESPKTSADFRGYAYNNNKDINVIFGGLEWSVTYLSTDKNGNPIATLWLADSTSLGADQQSTWSSGWYSSDASITYPSNMYGTSYIRSKLNGSQYAEAYDENGDTVDGTSGWTNIALTSIETGASNQISALKKFTGKDANINLSQYITQPRNVSWQEYCQIAHNAVADGGLGWEYDCPNENWGDMGTGTISGNDVTYMNGVYKFKAKTSGNIYTSLNYSSKGENNSAWADDYLWLPSFSETGSNDYDYGRWATSTAQRSDASGNDSTTAERSWLRSGSLYYANGSCSLQPAGGYDSNRVNSSYCVRPALHLNLGAMPLPVEHESNGVKYECINGEANVVGFTNLMPASITIPTSITVDNVEYEVTEIKSGAFNGANLESVTFTSETPITMGANVFGANSGVAIYVPTEYVGTYQSTWSAYSGQIEELPETGIELNLSILIVTLVLGGALLFVVSKKKKEQF